MDTPTSRRWKVRFYRQEEKLYQHVFLAVWENYTDVAIPLDTMWIDIDYMEAWKDWSYDPTLFSQSEVGSFVTDLHKNGQHFVLIVDPGDSFP